MANTLKFGNGNWATKEGFTLAYNDENGNFKPLPFSFSRGSVPIGSKATTINKDGLIEEVGNNVPRIDYLNDSNGALLLEPQSTNTSTYSNDFTQGDIFNSSGNPGKSNAVLTSQQITAPDGTNNGWLLKDNNDGGSGPSNLQYFSTQVNSDDFNTISIFVKKALSNDFLILESASYDADGNGRSYFNISNGSFGSISTNHTAKIEDYGDGWYRCSITFRTTTDVQGAIYIRLSSSNGTVDITRDGTNGVYLFGLQCEADATQNYPTSYIPTQGSAVTRLQDKCLKDDFSILTVGNSYTLFFDVDLNEKDDNKTFFNIENSSGSTSFTVRSVIGGMVRVYNNLDLQYPTGNLASSTNKWVVRIDGTSFKIFGAEGSLSGTLTTARDMGEGIFGRFTQTKINDFKVYNTALSDSESEALVN
jgi:hypothetical protein